MTRTLPRSRLLTAVLMPLALAPVALAIPRVLASQRDWERRYQSEPLPAPDVRLTVWQRHRFEPVAPYRRSVPVLLYHGIADEGDGQSITRRAFATQMAALHRMRFTALSTEQYLRFRRGDSDVLPWRPILITFDGGRLDSYRGADRVLARYGLRATMFVPTARLDEDGSAHLTWRELKEMERSGRWDVQSNGHGADRLVAADRRGTMTPFYATRRFTRSAGLESPAAFEQRVAEDLFEARETLESHGFRPRVLAVPYGDYGQRGGGDSGIVGELMRRQFGALLLQDPVNAPSYARARGDAVRYEVRPTTSADDLYMWLRDNSPGWIATHGRKRVLPQVQPAWQLLPEVSR